MNRNVLCQWLLQLVLSFLVLKQSSYEVIARSTVIPAVEETKTQRKIEKEDGVFQLPVHLDSSGTELQTETSILPPYRGSTVAASTSDVDVQQIHVKPASDSPTFGGHLPRGDKANEFHASKAWKIKLLIGVLVGGIGLSALVLILIVMADALARQRSSTDSVTSMRPPNVILSTGSSVPGGNAQVNVPKKSRKDYIGDTNCKQLPSSVHFDTQETETTEVPVMSQDTGV